VIDSADAGLCPEVEKLGVRPIVAHTVMSTADDAVRLAQGLLAS
jgi:hypothetical protein